MKPLLVCALFLVLIAPPRSASAQEWSVEQQDVLDHIQACWDAWESKSYDTWTSVCRSSEDTRFWRTTLALPYDMSSMRIRYDAWWEADPSIQIHANEMQPIEVQLFDDMALVYFYAHWHWSNNEGVQTVEQKRLEVFRKVDGQWTVVGGMIDPVDS